MTASGVGQDVIEIFDPMSPAMLKDPYAAYKSLRDLGAVAFLEPLDLWVVSRFADVRQVLAAPESFSAALAFGRDAVLSDSRSGSRRRLNLKFAGDSGGVVSSSDGADHTRLRRMVANLLSRPRLNTADGAINAHLQQIMTSLRARGDELDIVEDLAKPVAGKAIGDLMGLHPELIATLAAWVDLTFRALDPHDPLSTPSAMPQTIRSNLACVRAVTRFLDDGAWADPPAEPANGLLDAWRMATTPAAREEVLLSILQLFQAGYETVVSAVCFFLARFVIDHPDSSAHVADGDLFTQLVDEGLRLASPVRATFRTSLGPQRIDGMSIPDGAKVMLLLGSANRDERIFRDPDEPRLGRPTTHQAFGAGPHRCLGRFLAHLELKHILGALMSNTRRVLASQQPELGANILKATYHRLPVRVQWR